MLEQRKSAHMQDVATIERQMGKVKRGLQTLNDELGASKSIAKNNWCVNGTFSLADVAVGCMLGYINLRFGKAINLAAEYPNLERLQVALLKRQSFKNSMPVA
jgi:glutathione S-transferase